MSKVPENETKTEKAERLKAQRVRRLEKRMNRALSGDYFQGDYPHLIYPSPQVYKRQINAYFDLCELKHEPQTLPGLALMLGVRTEVLKQYDPGPDYKDFKRLTDFAFQRIEKYMATELSKGTGNTKGKEFLAQNTLGYANKSQVNGTQNVELTERKRVENLSDEEVISQLQSHFAKVLPFLPKAQDVG
jgi:hypothetical protein